MAHHQAQPMCQLCCYAQEKKKVLDKHTNLATALLTAIKNRGLDGFYNLEEDLLTGKADTGALIKLLQVRVCLDYLALALDCLDYLTADCSQQCVTFAKQYSSLQLWIVDR
eukprot:GHUV01045109.1.p1 GENE.GHUV01045109.1~~GHUV01045109.1.p1  ORF type:complete len:111 (-),score=17.98 GHUV01045109.1:150-482(-)